MDITGDGEVLVYHDKDFNLYSHGVAGVAKLQAFTKLLELVGRLRETVRLARLEL